MAIHKINDGLKYGDHFNKDNKIKNLATLIEDLGIISIHFIIVVRKF